MHKVTASPNTKLDLRPHVTLVEINTASAAKTSRFTRSEMAKANALRADPCNFFVGPFFPA